MTAKGDDRKQAMTRKKETSPPRPIAPGDVVVTYSDELGEWTAAQITDLNPGWRTAGVLELDWSGPEPLSVDDLGTPVPLRLTFAKRLLVRPPALAK